MKRREEKRGRFKFSQLKKKSISLLGLIVFCVMFTCSFTLNSSHVSAAIPAPTLNYPCSIGVAYGNINFQFNSVQGAVKYLFSLRNLETNALICNRQQFTNTTSISVVQYNFNIDSKYRWALASVDSAGNEYWNEAYFIVNGSNYMVINANDEPQQSSNWCWAACSRTTIRYLGAGNPTQWQIVANIFGSAGNFGATLGQQSTALTNFGITNSLVNTNTISFNTICDNVYGWYTPVNAAVAWSAAAGGGGHAIIVKGIDRRGSTQRVRIMDPLDDTPFGVPFDQWMNYSELLNGSWHTIRTQIIIWCRM